MDGTGAEKPLVAARSFLAVGPTLHYSHSNVQAFWFFALMAFGGVCIVWSRLTGGQLPVTLESIFSAQGWELGHISTSGISIFEYPWQILVLGLLMGIMAACPILVAQLLSFSYSVPFIFAVLLLAGLPGLAVSLVASCIGAACRPLRFRSRIIAIALCMAPQLAYWGIFGAVKGAEPVVWGISFAPWLAAWLSGLTFAGVVLGIGHLTRYRPGILLWTELAALIGACALFETTIGINELAYHRYVLQNAPEQVPQFHDHSLTVWMDRAIKDPAVRQYLSGFFYPADPIQLRQALKREIQLELAYDRWPTWFQVPEQLNYQKARQRLLAQYDRFIRPTRPWWMPKGLYQRIISRRTASSRMAVALYYKALVNDYTPDIPLVDRQEILRFAWDYPHERSRQTWYELYSSFSKSPESIEARLRIARHWAGQGYFELAENLTREAKELLAEELARQAQARQTDIRNPFHHPATSIMTEAKLRDLQARLERFSILIGPENHKDDPGSEARLAQFLMLNPYSMDYEARLQQLLAELPQDDPLRDNILLAQAKGIPDIEASTQRLQALYQQYPQTDGGKEALYELARLKIRMYQTQTSPETRKALVSEARALLQQVIHLYPDQFLAEQAKTTMATLPSD